MPRPGINDYTFYKIVNINGDIDLCYVGSTANFKQRKQRHRHNCNNENSGGYNRKLYKTIREHGGWEEFKLVEVGYTEQLTSTQAHIIEEGYRITLKAELNMIKCFRTDEERKEYEKEYRENNKGKVAEQKKEYYEKNKEKIAEYKKEYNEINKENLAAQKKQYREINKDKIREHKKEKNTCECGCIVTYGNLPRHKRSQKHIEFINNICIN